jgi:hypothetical protein
MKAAPKAAIAALAALGAVAPTAGAATPASASSCGNPESSKVFSQFGDQKSYFLAPDGGFEAGGDGWGLDGSSVVDGNESFNLNGADDSKSLSLPSGSSATSPAVCVTRKHPQFRFVAKHSVVVAPVHGGGGSTTGGDTTSGDTTSDVAATHAAGAPRLKVEVIYLNGKGRKKTRVAAKLRAGEEWAPTKKIAIAVGRATGRGKRKVGDVKFRFTPIGAADWSIDDVFVDPHARR